MWVWYSHQPGLAWEGRAGQESLQVKVVILLLCAQRYRKAKQAAEIHPHLKCALPAVGYSSSSSSSRTRTMLRAPAVLPRAGQPLPARLEPAPLMAKSSPQPPAAASDIPLLCQAMKISPTGLEQPWGRERLANIPSPRKASTTALGGCHNTGNDPQLQPLTVGVEPLTN